MVSIVITAYNVGEYIREAIESVLQQSHTDIECIVVEDCSNDSTLSIIEELKEGDNRIRLLRNEQNIGAGASRRRGIEAATGEYILLLDGDDTIESDFIETLYRSAIENDADIVSGGITVINPDGSREASSYGNCITEGTEKIEKFWGEKIVFMNNKLIRRRLYEATPYSTRRFIEDTPTIIKLLYHANKVAYTGNMGYNYRMHGESLTHKASKFKFALFRALCVEELVSFFEKHDKEYLKRIPLGRSYTALISQIKEMNPQKEWIKEFADEWIDFTTALIKRMA